MLARDARLRDFRMVGKQLRFVRDIEKDIIQKTMEQHGLSAGRFQVRGITQYGISPYVEVFQRPMILVTRTDVKVNAQVVIDLSSYTAACKDGDATCGIAAVLTKSVVAGLLGLVTGLLGTMLLLYLLQQYLP